MIDMFQDLWAAMTPEQQKGISWMAYDRNSERHLGEADNGDLMHMLIACLDATAKARSDNYEEYRDQVSALCQGAAIGLLDGGINYYLRNK